MRGLSESFRNNVAKYFEGPDPRSLHIPGNVVGGLRHTQFRDLGSFMVYSYEDGKGIRRGGSVKGAFVGVGQPVDRINSLIVFTRPDDVEVVRSWNYTFLGRISGVGFENVLEPEAANAAVEYAANPIVFRELSLFTGITQAQTEELQNIQKQHTELNRRFAATMNELDEMERQARAEADRYYIIE